MREGAHPLHSHTVPSPWQASSTPTSPVEPECGRRVLRVVRGSFLFGVGHRMVSGDSFNYGGDLRVRLLRASVRSR